MKGCYSPLDRLISWASITLPTIFDNSISTFEMICELSKCLGDVIENEKQYKIIIDKHGVDIKELKEDYALLNEEIGKIKNGEYTSMYIDSLSKWIDANLQELVAKIVKYVFFELDESGHLVAYIPESWQFITFDTIADPDGELYGHLTLEW